MPKAKPIHGKLIHVACLGWCDKKFWSPDPTRVRFCPKCRAIKEAIDDRGVEYRVVGVADK